MFNFKTGEDGKPSVTLDSPDQGAYGIAGEVNFISADSVNITVRRIGLTFSGRKQDGKLIGKCAQGTMSADLELFPGHCGIKAAFKRLSHHIHTRQRKFVSITYQMVLLSQEHLPCLRVLMSNSGYRNDYR